MTISQSDAIAALVAANRDKIRKVEAAHKAQRSHQTAARVVLADGMSELAKICRRFVAAQGADAEEKTAALVLSLLQVAENASAK